MNTPNFPIIMRRILEPFVWYFDRFWSIDWKLSALIHTLFMLFVLVMLTDAFLLKANTYNTSFADLLVENRFHSGSRGRNGYTTEHHWLYLQGETYPIEINDTSAYSSLPPNTALTFCYTPVLKQFKQVVVHARNGNQRVWELALIHNHWLQGLFVLYLWFLYNIICHFSNKVKRKEIWMELPLSIVLILLMAYIYLVV